VFIDDLFKLVNKDNIGCRIGASCTVVFLYANDIILLAQSVQALQLLVNICISELNYLDMAINGRKSACMRFGPLYKDVCANIVLSGALINWFTSSRYLCVYLESCSSLNLNVPLPKTNLSSTWLLIASSEKLDVTHQKRFCLL